MKLDPKSVRKMPRVQLRAIVHLLVVVANTANPRAKYDEKSLLRNALRGNTDLAYFLRNVLAVVESGADARDGLQTLRRMFAPGPF